MHVPFAQPEPIHRREMSDRIAGVRMQDQLRFRRRARGEIEQKRIARERRLAAGMKYLIAGIGLFKWSEARHAPARDQLEGASRRRRLAMSRSALGASTMAWRVAADDPIGEVAP